MVLTPGQKITVFGAIRLLVVADVSEDVFTPESLSCEAEDWPVGWEASWGRLLPRRPKHMNALRRKVRGLRGHGF